VGDNFDPKMAQLIEKSVKKSVDVDPTRCWLINILLSAEKYYMADASEGGKHGPTEAGMKFIDVYSVVNATSGGPEIVRHPVLVLVGTGYTMNYVKKPEWWNRRNGAEESKLVLQ
jgi:hypothetical protein